MILDIKTRAEPMNISEYDTPSSKYIEAMSIILPAFFMRLPS